MEQLDINKVVEPQDVDVKVTTREHPEERKSRLIREEAEAKHQRQKDFILFLVILVIVTTVLGVCFFIVLSKSYSADTEKAATALLTLIIGGLVGYLTGKNTSK